MERKILLIGMAGGIGTQAARMLTDKIPDVEIINVDKFDQASPTSPDPILIRPYHLLEDITPKKSFHQMESDRKRKFYHGFYKVYSR